MDEESDLVNDLAADLFSEGEGEEEDDEELGDEEQHDANGGHDGNNDANRSPPTEKKTNGHGPTKSSLKRSVEELLENIDHFQSQKLEDRNIGRMEDSPEYKTMTDASQISASIDSEILVLHKYIRDRYSQVLNGLEKLVENPVLYAKSVAILGNHPNRDLKDVVSSSDNIVGEALDRILDKGTLMGVRMDASTSKDIKPLSDIELEKVMNACQMIISYDKAKKRLREYVESRMNVFAPNLTILIGPETAAILVQQAGGIRKLAQIPSCNLSNIGSGGGRAAGLATNAGIAKKGAIYNSSLVMSVPRDHRDQAVRIVAAKTALACRSDASMTKLDDSVGRQLRDQIAQKLEKLSFHSGSYTTRALADPVDKLAAKRGGRAARAKKAREQQTELAKQANRMGFGSVEAEAGLSGEGLGSIGQEKTGSIRATQVNAKTAAKLSKKTRLLAGAGVSGLASSLRGFGQGSGTATGIRTSGVGTSLNGAKTGLESTIRFDTGGLELVDPRNRDEMNRKRQLEEDRYFQSGTFTSVGGGNASVIPQEPKVDSGGFKVPALPALKRIKKAG